MQILHVDNSDTPIQVNKLVQPSLCMSLCIIFQTDATAYSSAYFGQGIIPILLDDVGCSGSEVRLIDCPYDSVTSDCSHSEDAGVRCTTGQLILTQILMTHSRALPLKHAVVNYYDLLT